MRLRSGIALALVAAFACAPAVTFAQSPSMDKKFVADALQGGMAEVELAKLAAEKASSDAVKQFGKRMVEDHARTDEEIAGLAQRKGVTPPNAIDQPHRWLREKLTRLSGAEFDRRYVSSVAVNAANEIVRDPIDGDGHVP